MANIYTIGCISSDVWTANTFEAWIDPIACLSSIGLVFNIMKEYL